MAAVVRLKFNYAGFDELRKSAPIVAELTRRAERIAAAAGPDHEVRVWQSPRRARVSVTTADFDAMRAEAISKNLTRALDAGR